MPDKNLWQAYKMLPFSIIFIQCVYDGIQMGFISQEIGMGSIYKECFDIMLFNISRIGFLQAEQVIIRDGLFIGAVPFAYIFLQFAYRRMQVDQDIRLYDLRIDDIEQFLV